MGLIDPRMDANAEVERRFPTHAEEPPDSFGRRRLIIGGGLAIVLIAALVLLSQLR